MAFYVTLRLFSNRNDTKRSNANYVCKKIKMTVGIQKHKPGHVASGPSIKYPMTTATDQLQIYCFYL